MGKKAIITSTLETPDLYRKINDYLSLPVLSSGLNPEVFFKVPDYAPVLIATIMKQYGFEVEIIEGVFNLEKSNEKFINKLKENPDYLFFSTTHIFQKETLKHLKQLVNTYSPDTKVIAGGKFIILNSEFSVKDLYYYPYYSIYNLNYLKNNSPELGFVNDEKFEIDKLPVPDYSLYHRIPEFVSVWGVSGCQHRCRFCSYSEEPFSIKSPEKVSHEIINNYKKYGISTFRFIDSNLAFNKKWILKVLHGISEIKNLSWTGFTRIDDLDEEILEAFRKTGCKYLFIGLESGSQHILDRMNKGYTLDTVRKKIDLIRKYKIMIHANIVIGYPGETDDTLSETLKFLKEIQPDSVYFSPFQIRSKKIYENLNKEAGLAVNGDKWAHGTMTSDYIIKVLDKLLEEVTFDKNFSPVSSEIFASLLLSNRIYDEIKIKEFEYFIKQWNKYNYMNNGFKRKEIENSIYRILS